MSGDLLSEAERTRILAKAALFAPPAAQLPDGRRDLVGLSRAELTEALLAIGEKPFRAKQLWHWIYHQGVTDFARMSSVARPLQERLAEHFVIGRPTPALRQLSSDGTEKFLFRFRDGQEAETSRKTAVPFASPHKWAAPCRVAFVIPAHRPWCAISALRKSSDSLWRHATLMANGQAQRAKRRACSRPSC